MKIFIIIISILVGFLCSHSADLFIKYEKPKSEVKQLIEIIKECKEYDTKK